MFEYIIGYVVGLACGITAMAIDNKRRKVKRIVAQEERYVQIQQKVDSIVTDLQVIIHGDE